MDTKIKDILDLDLAAYCTRPQSGNRRTSVVSQPPSTA